MSKLPWEHLIPVPRALGSDIVRFFGLPRIIDPQHPAIEFLSLKILEALHRGLSIHKIRMCKASWLTCPSINGDPDIHDILDVSEKFVEICIRHLKCKVANEQSFARRVNTHRSRGLELVVYNEAAAVHDSLILGLYGSSCSINGIECDVTKPKEKISMLAQQ